MTGGTLNFSFPTHVNYAYTVQYKTNLTDASWSTLSVTNGTGVSATVSALANKAKLFYRLSIQ